MIVMGELYRFTFGKQLQIYIARSKKGTRPGS